MKLHVVHCIEHRDVLQNASSAGKCLPSTSTVQVFRTKGPDAQLDNDEQANREIVKINVCYAIKTLH